MVEKRQRGSAAARPRGAAALLYCLLPLLFLRGSAAACPRGAAALRY
ncbi:uncharacterized protein G2W53_026721 [Senna tora]|uniref:Uncharacterized protein n=1 Tax=Senna tora TaxID=362788 RepID=A0A834THI2_9FABA|nr:uncharacterized protein G2W53_026721 [Senna tora]